MQTAQLHNGFTSANSGRPARAALSKREVRRKWWVKRVREREEEAARAEPPLIRRFSAVVAVRLLGDALAKRVSARAVAALEAGRVVGLHGLAGLGRCDAVFDVALGVLWRISKKQREEDRAEDRKQRVAAVLGRMRPLMANLRPEGIATATVYIVRSFYEDPWTPLRAELGS